MKNDLILALDCDGCVMDTVGILEDLVAQINYCCSREFKTKIMDRAYNNNEMEQFKMYSDINRITKDEVLEELFDLYKNRIDYDELYQLKHAFKNVVKVITVFYNLGIFKKMYVVSHINSYREIEAKKRFFEKYLPFMELVFIPFHDKPYSYDKNCYYENANRKRTNKPEYFFKLTKEDPKHTIFIDDSSTICDEAKEYGCKAFYRNRESDDELAVFREMYDNIMGIENEDEKMNTLLKMLWI